MKTSVVRINKTQKERKLIKVITLKNRKEHEKEEWKRKEGKNLSVLMHCLCRNIQRKYTCNTRINRLILLVTICVVRNSGFCLLALGLLICSVPFSQTKLITSLNSINNFLFIRDTEYFLCEVRNDRLTERPVCKQQKIYSCFLAGRLRGESK